MTKSSFHLIGATATLLVSLVCVSSLRAQEVITPSQGKGHVVVFLSGMAGPKHDKALAEDLASLGYVVVVYDGRHMEGGFGQKLRTAIQNAQQTPNALPGKVALVGVSLGGGFALAFGSRWPDLVAVDIVWYPATGFANRMPGFVNRITVPVLMFAGEADHYQRLLPDRDRPHVGRPCRSGRSSLRTRHLSRRRTTISFKGGSNYNPSVYNDALDRTTATLKAAFAN
jgi:pimeloyl-ACP methyl ester carboxylesterase